VEEAKDSKNANIAGHSTSFGYMPDENVELINSINLSE
jgi:hypothetical protein